MATARVQKLLLRGIPENTPEVLAQDDWEAAWADEIDARLEAHRAGSSPKQDLSAFLERLAAKR